jgi:hypothetical protein
VEVSVNCSGCPTAGEDGEKENAAAGAAGVEGDGFWEDGTESPQPAAASNVATSPRRIRRSTSC